MQLTCLTRVRPFYDLGEFRCRLVLETTFEAGDEEEAREDCDLGNLPIILLMEEPKTSKRSSCLKILHFHLCVLGVDC